MSQQNLFVIRVLIGVVIVLSLCALFAWYFYLRTNTLTTEVADMGRGLGTTAPSFTGDVGSTYKNVTESSGEGDVAVAADENEIPELWQVSQNPVSGVSFVGEKDTMAVRFVERATGNILSADTKTGRISRLTNTLMPKIYGALFSSDGSVVLQSMDDTGSIATFAGTLVAPPPPQTAELATTTVGTLKGVYLDKGVVSYTVSPKTREVFYLVKDSEKGVVGISNTWDGTKPKRIFQSGIAGWNTSWLSDGRIILAQKPAYDVPGYAYELSPSGALSPVLRNIKGLSLLVRTDSKAVIYSSSADKTLALFVKNGDQAAIQLSIKTIADKCVWAPGKELVAYCAVPTKIGVGNFIDNWLQGRFYTIDTWWRVDASNGEVTEVKTLQNSAQYPIDVRKPTISASGTHIAFSSGEDASLWLLRLTISTSTSQ